MESTLKKERVRACNFTEQEKSLIINLVAKYKDIIENKKTDGVTNLEKNKTWAKITLEFNAISPGNNNRSVEQLKRFYENKKKELRKKTAERKILLGKTGGGPPPDDSKENYEDLLLSITNEKTVFGLPSQYDGDAELAIPCEGDGQSSEIEFEVTNADIVVADLSEHDYMTNPWKKYKPSNLKEPISMSLQETTDKIEPDQPTTSGTRRLNNKSSTRRRCTTVVKALTSSDISKKYNELLDVRLEIASKVKQQLQQELTHNKLKFDKEMELLNLKIECSKQTLEKMKNTNQTNNI
ncbi:unnamed protein product [Callosobruchus maculatus]|uniref:Regulatory protein zeste n=1 Tax=Callosobruchus maculatus TaxID=64391 RepID=A0A653BQ73_CALMS|nr:unnamed protein product [Callosobruchus maculatus]